jgi:hypothetical protein
MSHPGRLAVHPDQIFQLYLAHQAWQPPWQ